MDDSSGLVRPKALLRARRMYRALAHVVDDTLLVDYLWLVMPKGEEVPVAVLPGEVLARGLCGLNQRLNGAERAELVCSAMIFRGTATTQYVLEYPDMVQLRPLYRKLKGEVPGKTKKPRKTPLRQPQGVKWGV